MALHNLVFGVEEEALSLLTTLLLFLLRPRLFLVKLRLDFLVVLRKDQVVRERVGLLVLNSPRNLFLEHVVHGRDNLGGHVDETLSQDKADGRDWSLGKELRSGGEGRVGGGFGLEVVDQVLDDGFVLEQIVSIMKRR